MGIADIKNIHLFEGTGGPGKEKEDKIVVLAGTGGMKYEDWLKGDEYDALAKRYSEAGRKAADDTMGIAAARTGGLASSYAVSAGAQAYGGYMERLEDAARALYESERNSDQWERQFAYSKERDQIEDQRLGRDDAREQILTLIQSGKLDDADIPDELLTASGWDPLTVEAYKSYYSNDDQSLILDFDADEIVEQLEGGNVNPSTLATYYHTHGASYSKILIEDGIYASWDEKKLKSVVDDFAKSGDEEGAEALYDAWYSYHGDENKPPKSLVDRTYTLVDDGGWNWFWGVDGNAKVKDESGTEYTLDDLVDALVNEGMTKKEAKKWVTDHQKDWGV